MMNHTLRRSRQALPPEVCTEILNHASTGVLALSTSDGQPYAVPLNFVHNNGTLYFHSANAGHKLDLIRDNSHASFCIVADDHVVPERYTTFYRSVIAFGQVRIVEDAEEARRAIAQLGRKYVPQASDAELQKEIDTYWSDLTMIAMSIDQLSGKEAIDLAKMREDENNA